MCSCASDFLENILGAFYGGLNFKLQRKAKVKHGNFNHLQRMPIFSTTKQKIKKLRHNCTQKGSLFHILAFSDHSNLCPRLPSTKIFEKFKNPLVVRLHPRIRHHNLWSSVPWPRISFKKFLNILKIENPLLSQRA